MMEDVLAEITIEGNTYHFAAKLYKSPHDGYSDQVEIEFKGDPASDYILFIKKHAQKSRSYRYYYNNDESIGYIGMSSDHWSAMGGSITDLNSLLLLELEGVITTKPYSTQLIEEIRSLSPLGRDLAPPLIQFAPSNTGVYIGDPMEFTTYAAEEPKPVETNVTLQAPKCTCGAAKTGVANYKAGHSAWCDVYGGNQ